MKRVIFLVILAVSLLTGCLVDDSDIVNRNIKRNEQNFREFRRVVFYNGITEALSWTF